MDMGHYFEIESHIGKPLERNDLMGTGWVDMVHSG